jgi:hypothetical protein
MQWAWVVPMDYPTQQLPDRARSPQNILLPAHSPLHRLDMTIKWNPHGSDQESRSAGCLPSSACLQLTHQRTELAWAVAQTNLRTLSADQQHSRGGGVDFSI